MTPRRLALLWLGASLSLVATAAVADDPYAEYRIPDHRWLSWTGTFSASGGRSAYDAYGRRENSGLGANGASSLTGGFDSDARSHAYGLALRVDAGRARLSDHDEYSVRIDTDRERKSTGESASGFLAFSRYPRAVPVGLSLGVKGRFDLEQSWQSEQRRIVDPPSEERRTDDYSTDYYLAFATLTASMSLGRVRDATPVYQVQVLEQRLLELGTISSVLSPGGRQRLASLYTIESDVAFAHQRPTKYFWQELERVLRDDGVLGDGGLDAYSVQRLLEPLTIAGSKIARARGFAFGPMVTMDKAWIHSSVEGSSSETYYDHDTVVTATNISIDRRSDFHRETILSGLFVDYHRPLGMRWQVDVSSRALIPQEGQVIDWANQASVDWLVADRWFASALIHHELNAPGHGTERRPESWSVDYAASVNYFLEDAWSFRLGWSGLQSSSTYLARQDSFSLGFTYQFAGWLSAPDVFAPMRLSPPSR